MAACNHKLVAKDTYSLCDNDEVNKNEKLNYFNNILYKKLSDQYLLQFQLLKAISQQIDIFNNQSAAFIHTNS